MSSVPSGQKSCLATPLLPTDTTHTSHTPHVLIGVWWKCLANDYKAMMRAGAGKPTACSCAWLGLCMATGLIYCFPRIAGRPQQLHAAVAAADAEQRATQAGWLVILNCQQLDTAIVFSARFVHRTNRRIIALMFVRPSVCPSVSLSGTRAFIVIIVFIRCTLAQI